MKKAIIIIASIVIIIALALSYTALFKPKQDEPAQKTVDDVTYVTTTNKSGTETKQMPAQTSLPEDDEIKEVWKIEIPDTEIDLQSSLENSSVVIASKNNKHVIVYIKELKNNLSEILLEYDELLSYDNSGNYWSGLSPSIALSPNKKLLAFADENGPKIYNIDNKEIILLATKIKDAIKGNDLPDNTPKWSNSDISYVYNFYAPEWSFDSKHVSFKQSLYEGSSMGIFNIETKQYLKIEGFFGNNIKWSPAKNLIIAGGESDGYDSSGLYSSESVSNFAKLVKKSVFDDRKFNLREMAFSRNGENIALIYNNFNVSGPGDNSYALSYADNNFDKVGVISDDLSIEKTFPFFSADSNSIYYIENKKILVKYNLQNQRKIEVAILPDEIDYQNDPIWTDEGYLSIIIKNRHLILDLDKHKILYASLEQNTPLALAGFF